MNSTRSLIISIGFFFSLGSQSFEALAQPSLIRSFSLGNILRFTPVQPNAVLPGQDTFQIRSSYSVANLWGHGEGFMIDAQVDDTVVTSSVKLKESFTLNAGFAKRVMRASNLDPLIVGFHDLFGFTQGERLSVPQDDSNLALPEYQLKFDKRHIDRTFNQHVFASLNYKLPIDEMIGDWDVGIISYYELFDGLTSQQGEFGEGIQSSFLRRNDQMTYSAGFTFMNYHSKSAYTKELLQQQLMVNSGVDYALYENHILGTQLLIGQGVFKDLGQLSRATYEIYATYQYREDFGSIDFAIIENIFWPYNTPDFGWSVGVSYTAL